MNYSKRAITLLLLAVTFTTTLTSVGCIRESNTLCMETEKQALLTFKQSLKVPSNLLSSWNNDSKDCCAWEHVVCDNLTGHVLELHLQSQDWNSQLGGEINPSLLNLKHLAFLDLSRNNFSGLEIPSFIGSLASLEYLDLSSSGFQGMIPQSFANLSSLRTLYLNRSSLEVDNIRLLSSLVNLEYLDLSSVNLSRATGWLETVNKLPNLIELHLSTCDLDKISPLDRPNFSSLEVLDLSFNLINSSLPNWIFNLGNVVSLHLEGNKFQGPIPSTGNMPKLRYLDLAWNKLNSTLPEWLFNSYSLEYLDLYRNRLSGVISKAISNLSSLRVLSIGGNHFIGSVPLSLGQLFNLEELSMEDNMLEGIVTEDHFSNLSKLTHISAFENSLTLRVREDWIPPFQLQVLELDSWNLGSQLPLWLQTQRSLERIGLSNTGISGEIPTWISNLSRLSYLSLSHNKLSGEISHLTNVPNYVDLSSNQLSGPLPLLSNTMVELDLSNNSFSGGISHTLCHSTNTNVTSLAILHLGRNNLSGEIPDCWTNWRTALNEIHLGENNFYGRIPSSLGDLGMLWSLNLNNNALSGHIPSSVQNCTNLNKVDLSGNKLEGYIPTWIGTNLSIFKILILRSNKFSGEITPDICKLTTLQILDLADNRIFGAIPTCLNNLTAISSKGEVAGDSGTLADSLFLKGEIWDGTSLTTKGMELSYDKILMLFSSIDLSNNNLSGTIPKELTSLAGLRSLNLSGNNFSGSIPDTIGGMESLESLDFSENHLSGEIPLNLSHLTSLSYLNLSHNDLSGRIPHSTQLQSFDPSSYIGNDRLCGSPLLKQCEGDVDANTIPGNRSISENKKGDSEDFESLIDMWFYVCMGFGFLVGFWVWWGTLTFKNSWRYAYLNFLDDMWNKVTRRGCVS